MPILSSVEKNKTEQILFFIEHFESENHKFVTILALGILLILLND